MSLQDLGQAIPQNNKIEKYSEDIYHDDGEGKPYNSDTQINSSILELLKIIDHQRPDLNSATKRLKELLHRVKLQKQFLKYQYDHFHKIIKGQIKDLKRRKELQQLNEGQALSADESLSVALEHRMAIIIQRQIRKKFGRVFRTNLRIKMERSALLFQRTWRKYLATLTCHERSIRQKLALVIQRSLER